jgi:hypothetical protein
MQRALLEAAVEVDRSTITRDLQAVCARLRHNRQRRQRLYHRRDTSSSVQFHFELMQYSVKMQ